MFVTFWKCHKHSRYWIIRSNQRMYALTTKCSYIWPLAIIYFKPWKPCATLRIEQKVFLDGEVFSIRTSFYTELRKFWCSSSAHCTRNNSIQNKSHIFQKRAFIQRKRYKPQNILVRQLDQRQGQESRGCRILLGRVHLLVLDFSHRDQVAPAPLLEIRWYHCGTFPQM